MRVFPLPSLPSDFTGPRSDFRQTIYWNPSVKTDAKGRASVTFQLSDAVTSFGGSSGAVPNEKITWGKIAVDTPKFMIQSYATIVAPLIFAYLLGD